MFDTGAIVPAAVEEDHFLRRGKIGHVPLEIPRRAIMVGWLSERYDAGLARAQMLDDTLDRAVLSGGIPALEDNQNPVAVFDDVSLDLDELDLQVV
ncbi:hypothetical protein M2226_001983 [Bradyrhizobium elkanii]|nr:hypothetical protein [Bradyrhizobium elkanii]MCP1976717.1 hypothetical protein [Bradyrhizobium elkanii]MCS3523889.1 hypothetical protein [Bradyrhizobium elkanii]MCS4071545.1 hypothetical protein [Bradyrhizobium elkanii]MCS4078177.1 hypothetical protein [Bradyrhizobium elkanii]